MLTWISASASKDNLHMITFGGQHSNAVTDRCAPSTKEKCYSKVVRWERKKKKKSIRQEELIGNTKNWFSWIEHDLTCWSLN